MQGNCLLRSTEGGRLKTAFAFVWYSNGCLRDKLILSCGISDCSTNENLMNLIKLRSVSLKADKVMLPDAFLCRSPCVLRHLVHIKIRQIVHNA